MVSIYSNNAYESFDLDFVSEAPSLLIDQAMKELGFRKRGGRHYVHPMSRYYVEFVDGPAGIGNAWVTRHATRRTRHGRLDLYDPTQCVMDRLAAWFHWGDAQGLEQALLVARRKVVRLTEIRRWAKGEGHPELCNTFETRLQAARRGHSRR